MFSALVCSLHVNDCLEVEDSVWLQMQDMLVDLQHTVLCEAIAAVPRLPDAIILLKVPPKQQPCLVLQSREDAA